MRMWEQIWEFLHHIIWKHLGAETFMAEVFKSVSKGKLDVILFSDIYLFTYFSFYSLVIF